MVVWKNRRDASMHAVSEGNPKRGPAATVAAGAGPQIAEKYGLATLMFDDQVVSSRELPAVPGSDRYLLVDELGRGGMGRVDAVYDRVLGRQVAQKRVHDPALERYLVSEAQIGAQLEHPALVPIYDVGTDADGRAFYTMRVVDGRTLYDVLYDIPEARPGLGSLLGILRQVCFALDYAHSRGVVHRDLKPDNIIIGKFGEVYVIDWGVAYVDERADIRQGDPLPGSEAVAGSPAYMAPEQALGEPLDGRSDIYALGVILYEIFAGELPFDDHDLVSAVRRARRRSEAPGLRANVRTFPPPFDELVVSCLQRRPDDRPQNARLIAEAIDGFLDQERALLERLREADAHVAEGEAAWREHVDLDAQAGVLAASAHEMLAELAAHEEAEKKRPAWAMAERSRRTHARAARALAHAETAFAQALGRVKNHPGARAGLARLYYHEFLAAERASDDDRMARHLDLARSYDDGPLALELADEGELAVEVTEGVATITLARYERAGPLLALEPPTSLGETPTAPRRVASGSYVVTAVHGEISLRYPVVVERARALRLSLRLPSPGAIPEGMVLIPGGPFLSQPRVEGTKTRAEVDDFALASFPVTLREYAAFLDSLDDGERLARMALVDGQPALKHDPTGWTLNDHVVEGAGRRRVPPDRELDLPAFGVSWYDARAYAAWLARESGRPYRLPTALEWEKAMRGADGRPFPMGHQLDPSFAKIRASRPEETQLEPVGAFPLDVSPYGVRDLAGGVCDWTATFVDGAPPPSLEEEGTEADERRAFHLGGHWGSAGEARGYFELTIRHRASLLGFRLALTLSEGSSTLVDTSMHRAAGDPEEP
jgi:eukaryotic-like serine/threonine-protein kinase